jgi:hypothetical protein
MDKGNNSGVSIAVLNEVSRLGDVSPKPTFLERRPRIEMARAAFAARP